MTIDHIISLLTVLFGIWVASQCLEARGKYFIPKLTFLKFKYFFFAGVMVKLFAIKVLFKLVDHWASHEL